MCEQNKDIIGKNFKNCGTAVKRFMINNQWLQVLFVSPVSEKQNITRLRRYLILLQSVSAQENRNKINHIVKFTE